MADPVEPILVVLSVVAAIAAVGFRVATGRSASLDRLRGRRVDRAILCPRSGARAMCRFIYRETTDDCLGVDACSARHNDVPMCDHDCVKLLNLGIPLRPEDAPR